MYITESGLPYIPGTVYFHGNRIKVRYDLQDRTPICSICKTKGHYKNICEVVQNKETVHGADRETNTELNKEVVRERDRDTYEEHKERNDGTEDEIRLRELAKSNLDTVTEEDNLNEAMASLFRDENDRHNSDRLLERDTMNWAVS